MGGPANLWPMVLAVAIAVGIGFLVPVLLELRRSAKRLTAVLTVTEESLPQILRELRATLQHLDRVAGDMGEVTGDVRDVTRSLRRVGPSLALMGGAGAGGLYLARLLFTRRR